MSRSAVAVVIVNFNTGHLVLEGLQALVSERAAGHALRVVVVDNASTDESFNTINLGITALGCDDWVTCIANQENRGFAAGNNVGVWRSRRWKDFEPTHFLFLNPDARICPGAIAELLQASEQLAHAAILGAQLVNEDGSTRASAFRFPGILSEFARGSGLGIVERLLPACRVVLTPTGHEPFRADWVSGAAFMVPAFLWRRLGEMDERYFLYYEEVDYQRRAADKGYSVWSVPSAQVVHIAGAATGIVGGNTRGKPMPDYWYHSWHWYFLGGKGRLVGGACAVAWVTGRLLRIARASWSHALRSRLLEDGHTIARFWRIAVQSKPPVVSPQAVAGAAPLLPDGSSNRNPTGIGLFQLLVEDFRTHESDWTSQGFWAVAVHRFGNWRMSVRPRLLRFPLTLVYRTLRKASQVFGGIKLDYTVALGRRVKLEHFGGMVLGARSIGDDVVIRQNTTLGVRNLYDLNAKPMIGSRVEIGAGAVVVGHVHIGDDAVIGSNAVVSFDVPQGARVRAPKTEMRLTSPSIGTVDGVRDGDPGELPVHATPVPQARETEVQDHVPSFAYFAVANSREA